MHVHVHLYISEHSVALVHLNVTDRLFNQVKTSSSTFLLQALSVYLCTRWMVYR